MSEVNKPFRLLGEELKNLRQKLRENLAEVSGAVEIDIDTLAKIERGEEAPSEDVLLLLISHFGTKEDQASHLWELAGYDEQKVTMSHIGNIEEGKIQPGIMVLPMDIRIVYTDMVHVMVNNYGVVMNFMQGAGPNNQPLAIARIGMSREHAQSVLEILQQTLAQADKPAPTKFLPASKTKKNDQTKN